MTGLYLQSDVESAESGTTREISHCALESDLKVNKYAGQIYKCKYVVAQSSSESTSVPSTSLQSFDALTD